MEQDIPVRITDTAAIVPDPNLPPFEGDDAPAPAPAKPAQDDKGAKPKDPAAELRRENEELRRRTQELEASERYWASRAKGGDGRGDEPDNTGDGEPAAAPLDEAPTPEAFLDALSAKGPEAIIAELKRRGLVFNREEIAKISTETGRRVVQVERGKMTVDAVIARDFPELKDDSSDLFRRTREILRANVELEPALARSPAALVMAASQAKAELKATAPKKATADYREDDDSGDKQDGRRRRIQSQQGDLGRDSGAPFEGDDDTFGPEAREVVSMFAKAGVDEKSYRQEKARERRR